MTQKRDRDEILINDFAFRCFLEIADQDYIAARMANRAELFTQFSWAGQQAIEKYLKYLLLRNRIKATDVRHDLEAGLAKINSSGKIALNLRPNTIDFIKRLNATGQNRYLEISNVWFRTDLIELDRTVWELRRYCTNDQNSAALQLTDKVPAPRVRIEGGLLERILANDNSPAREPLLWQNAYFGRRRKKIKVSRHIFLAVNAPLSLNPHIVDRVVQYVYLPTPLANAYRQLAAKKRKNQP